MKSYYREERDLVLSTTWEDMPTTTLPKLHAIITDELTKCNNRLTLLVGVCLSKKGSIVIITAPRAPVSSIRANIEALLPQISAVAGSTCDTNNECQQGIFFLRDAVLTFERGTTKTQDEQEIEYLDNLHRQIAAYIAVPTSMVKLLRNREHRDNSNSNRNFMGIIVMFELEPTFAIPSRIPAEKTTWRIYNRSCKTKCMHPNVKNHYPDVRFRMSTRTSDKIRLV